ncbi:hypothetical protein RFI_25745, partial [Reticulomyxa filosa]
KNSGSKRPPTLQDMTDILNGSRPVRRDFLEEPPEVPSWAPLLKSFFDESSAEEEYFDNGPELAGAVAPQPKSANNKPLSKIKRHNASIAKPPQTPAAGPPKIQYGNSEQEAIEETEVKAETSAPQQSGGPPPVPVAALNKKPNAAPSTTTTSSTATTEKKTTATTATTTATTTTEKKLPTLPVQVVVVAKLAQRGAFNANQQTKTNVINTAKNNSDEKKTESKPNTTVKKNDTSSNAKIETKSTTSATNTKAANNAKKSSAPPNKTDSYKWLCHLDPQSGDVYYENIASGETQWERPAEPVKPYWLAHNDSESGDMYFENIDTGATSWEKPDEFADAEEKWLAKKNPETGDYFYENLATGKTQWEVPPAFQEKQPQQEWMRHFDPNSGDYYYENLRTGETTWDAPSGIKFD